jgi:hypothetical protein
MKALVVLCVLVASTAVGQIDNMPSVYVGIDGKLHQWGDTIPPNPYYSGGVNEWVRDGDRVVPRHINSLHNLCWSEILVVWGSYKSECWADSTKHNAGYMRMGKEIKPGLYEILDDGARWSHRQPTLDGFMEYLRKLTK